MTRPTQHAAPILLALSQHGYGWRETWTPDGTELHITSATGAPLGVAVFSGGWCDFLRAPHVQPHAWSAVFKAVGPVLDRRCSTFTL